MELENESQADELLDDDDEIGQGHHHHHHHHLHPHHHHHHHHHNLHPQQEGEDASGQGARVGAQVVQNREEEEEEDGHSLGDHHHQQQHHHQHHHRHHHHHNQQQQEEEQHHDHAVHHGHHHHHEHHHSIVSDDEQGDPELVAAAENPQRKGPGHKRKRRDEEDQTQGKHSKRATDSITPLGVPMDNELGPPPPPFPSLENQFLPPPPPLGIYHDDGEEQEEQGTYQHETQIQPPLQPSAYQALCNWIKSRQDDEGDGNKALELLKNVCEQQQQQQQHVGKPAGSTSSNAIHKNHDKPPNETIATEHVNKDSKPGYQSKEELKQNFEPFRGMLDKIPSAKKRTELISLAQALYNPEFKQRPKRDKVAVALLERIRAFVDDQKAKYRGRFSSEARISHQVLAQVLTRPTQDESFAPSFRELQTFTGIERKTLSQAQKQFQDSSFDIAKSLATLIENPPRRTKTTANRQSKQNIEQ